MIEPAIEMASRPSPDGRDRVGVDHVFAEGQHQFWMWQGRGNHAMSTPVSALEALTHWQVHLAAAGAQWLLPWLTRIAAGEAIAPAAILEAARTQAAT